MRRGYRLALAGLLVQTALFGQTQSSTTLTALPSPSTYGQPVTLIATATSGATGKVTFYDGVTVLGVGTLSGTQATISTVMLSSGKRKLRAYYQGDGTYAPSSSTAIQQTVTAGQSLAFQQAVFHSTTTSAFAMAVGDFNGDGKQDLVATTIGSTPVVTIYLGNGDGTFQSGASSAVGTNPVSVAAGDFDGDGRMDLAVANQNSNNVSVLLGTGYGTFQPAVNIPLGASPSYIAIADFNGDGVPDLAVSTNSGTAILLGKGDGTFQPPAYLTETLAAVADVNCDGNADLLSWQGGGLVVLFGNGNGTFQTAKAIPGASLGSALATADFNGDGQVDLLLTSGATLTVMLGNGDGTFRAPWVYPLFNNVIAAVADFDGDGNLDIVAIPGPSSAFWVLPGKGDGTFGAAISYAIPDGYVTSLVVGDFNGDGKADLALAGGTFGYTTLLGGAVADLTIAVSHTSALTRGATGTYNVTVTNLNSTSTAGPVTVSVTLPSSMTATSFTGPAWSCDVATVSCTSTVPLSGNTSYPIALTVNVTGGSGGNVTGTFTVLGGGETNTGKAWVTDTAFVRYPSTTALTASPNPSVLGQTVTLTAALTAGASGRVEFYGGVVEIGSAAIVSGKAVLTTSSLPPDVTSIRAYFSGDSSYGPSSSAAWTQTVNPLAGNGMLPHTTYGVAPEPGWIGAGDLNGDGKTDLIAASAASPGTVSVLFGNGDGTFRPAVSYHTATGGFAVLGDFNNDGKLDVAATNPNGIVVLPGNGDGTFGAAISTPTTAAFTTFAASDFNGDGVPDLVAASGSGIVLFIGNGDGTFQAPVTVSPSSYTFLNVADMNGDGKPDLVAVSSSWTNNPILNVFLGNGDGTFQPAKTTQVANTAIEALAVGDFTGDGKPDVALCAGVVKLLPGNGDGTFQSPVVSTLGGGVSASFAIAGDFNGDGHLDLVSTYPGSNSVVLIFGNGDGTFRLGPTLPIDGYGTAIALGDFNRDGYQDFAVVSSVSSSVDIYLGGQFSGLAVSSTHPGRFTAGQTGTYQIAVGDAAFTSFSGTVSVTDTLPSGLSASSIGGNGWNCILNSLTCTRSDSLLSGTGYPSISIAVNVSATLPPSSVTNQVSVTTGGVTSSASDLTTIVLPTTTMLAVSPAPSTFGQPAALTATVTAGPTGRVLFMAGGMTLGTATISGNQAIINTRVLPSGVNVVVAFYLGDATHAPSNSYAVQQTVQTSAANGFSASATYPTGAGSVAIAAGDFNHDGNMDLITANSTANTVSVLLGNGDGTFQANADYAVGTHPFALAVADFNNDGRPDIAVVNNNSSISILLGNADGTFQNAMTIPIGDQLSRILVSDFNGDGNADLMAFYAVQYNPLFLFGNGDGTFRFGPTPIPYGIVDGVVGDFNGDGIADIVDTLGFGVFLGNGDGTFQRKSNPTEDVLVAAGDLNSDGKMDIVTFGFGAFQVFLGNGDGTFQGAVSYSTSLTGLQCSIFITDVNGDGKMDVVIVTGSTIGVFLGNGDGTLQPATYASAGTISQSAITGNFNGDGRVDLAIVDGTNKATVLLGVLTPLLSVNSSHSDPFLVGQTGATYTITVANNGPGTVIGPITVTDSLPQGETATQIEGTAWQCTVSPLSCTNTNSLSPGQNFSPITLTVNVSTTNFAPGTNWVSASGQNAVSGLANDPTTFVFPPITIQTVPPGLQFTLGYAAAQIAPQTVNLPQGTYPLSVSPTQAGSPGTQYVFTGWSDPGAASRTITVSGAATYTAAFKTQYQLTTAAFPPSGGTVTPASAAYYDAGTPMTLTATPNSPLIFIGWSGINGTTNPLQLSIDTPTSVTAIFDVPGATCTMTGDSTPSVADAQFIMNEALGIVPANNDLNADGAVNIADVQMVIGGVLKSACVH